MNSVRFIGYWMTSLPGDSQEVWTPMYQGEETKGSHLSDDTLHERGIPIPLTPTYQTWKNLVEAKRTCGRCFHFLRNEADRAHHMKTNHGAAL